VDVAGAKKKGGQFQPLSRTRRRYIGFAPPPSIPQWAGIRYCSRRVGETSVRACDVGRRPEKKRSLISFDLGGIQFIAAQVRADQRFEGLGGAASSAPFIGGRISIPSSLRKLRQPACWEDWRRPCTSGEKILKGFIMDRAWARSSWRMNLMTLSRFGLKIGYATSGRAGPSPTQRFVRIGPPSRCLEPGNQTSRRG